MKNGKIQIRKQKSRKKTKHPACKSLDGVYQELQALLNENHKLESELVSLQHEHEILQGEMAKMKTGPVFRLKQKIIKVFDL